MARFVKGEVVIVPFPFSDLSDTKRRPAMVLLDLPGEDVVLCQITSQAGRDEQAISLTEEDFDSGSLRLNSYVRPNRLFTFERRLILGSCGRVKTSTVTEIVDRLVTMLRQ